jgi:hypothetical protein
VGKGNGNGKIIKSLGESQGFLHYGAATFFWKKSLNFFLVSMVFYSILITPTVANPTRL